MKPTMMKKYTMMKYKIQNKTIQIQIINKPNVTLKVNRHQIMKKNKMMQ